MLGLAVEIRNEKLNAIRDRIDAGGGPAKLRVFSGRRPPTGGSPTTLLAELTFSYPCAPDAVEATLVFNAIAREDKARASGKATWARVVDAAGKFVMDLDAGGPGSLADAELDAKDGEIVEGADVNCPTFVLTEMDA